MAKVDGSPFLPNSLEFVSFVTTHFLLPNELRQIILKLYKSLLRGIFFDSDFLFSFGGTAPRQPTASILLQAAGIRITDFFIYVVRGGENGDVKVYSHEGKWIKNIGSELIRPIGVCIDKQNRILVAESGKNKINMFHHNGDLLKEFGQNHLDKPWGVVVDRKDQIIVTSSKGVVSFFDKDGNFIKHTEKKLEFPRGIGINSRNEIFVCHSAQSEVVVFDEEGEFIRSFGKLELGTRMYDLLIDGEDKVLVSDGSNIVIYNREGEFLSKFGELGKGAGKFDICLGLEIDYLNRLYVVEYNIDPRVQVFGKKIEKK